VQNHTKLRDIIEREISFEYTRSSGPGGQNVNKVATAVQLHFDIKNSPSLAVEVKERMMKLAGHHLTQEGVLIIEAKRFRSQQQNRSDAEQRLMVILLHAMNRPRRRRPTRPTLASQVRRLEDKKRRGRTKNLRTNEKHPG